MFRHGFKTWAENTALATRRRLGLRPTDPIDLKSLASHLGARVIAPEEVPDIEQAVLDTLLKKDPRSWSAITIRSEGQIVIVVNSSHTKARQASNLAHELSHLLIGHGGSKMGISPDGLLLTAYDKQQEEEAGWLAGCLLLPRAACVHIKKKRLADAVSTKEYGVSPEMLRFRLNASGAEKESKNGK